MSVRKITHWLALGFLILGGAASAGAQSSTSPVEEQQRLVFYEAFEGSSNSDGQVMVLTSSATYKFSEHFAAGLGIPIYFDRNSSSATGTTSSSGIGNVFASLRGLWKNPSVNYATSLTGSAPTGDSTKGLSTGHGTFDWDNRFDRDFAPFTPFADLGLANTITDTRFFHRPFTSYGKLAHFEAGTDVDLSHSLSLTLSAYDIAPWGTQTVISRFVKGGAAGNPGAIKHGRVFENAHETTGGAELARDNGYTVGLSASPKPYLDFELGYTRSVHFALNTVSFGVGVNLSSLIGRSTRSAFR